MGGSISSGAICIDKQLLTHRLNYMYMYMYMYNVAAGSDLFVQTTVSFGGWLHSSGVMCVRVQWMCSIVFAILSVDSNQNTSFVSPNICRCDA